MGGACSGVRLAGDQDRAERMRVEKMLHETTVSQGHRVAYQREIEDAAALMKGIYPEDAGASGSYLERILLA